MEFRIKDVNLQAEDDGLMKVGGYINVTERESEILYSKKRNTWFKEVMKKGVFQRAINNAREIPLLFEHNWNKELASTGMNTLSLKEDNVGLKFEAIIEDRSVYEEVKNGIINSCSFGFRALKEAIEPISSRLERRLVSDIELLEVSLVKNPAYVGSLAEVRAYEEEVAEEEAKKKAEEEATEESTEESASNEEVEGKTEETTSDEEVEESTEDVSKTENVNKDEEEDTEETEEESDERQGQAFSNVEAVPVISKEILAEIVDELIEQKMSDIKKAEYVEMVANEQLEQEKDFHKEIENELKEECMQYNAEVIKMRVALMKLQMLKEGI